MKQRQQQYNNNALVSWQDRPEHVKATIKGVQTAWLGTQNNGTTVRVMNGDMRWMKQHNETEQLSPLLSNFTTTEYLLL